MIRLLIGTGNPAKLRRYRTIIGEQFPGLRLLSLRELAEQPPAIVEDGATARENARKKVLAYARHARLPTLGIDEALAIPALPPDRQPGVRVRRYGGRELGDVELLDLYLATTRHLAADRRAVTWTYALCLALPGGEAWSDEVRIHARLLDRPSLPVLPGYPLSSILASPRLGKPLRDLSPDEQRQHLAPLYAKVELLLRPRLADASA